MQSPDDQNCYPSLGVRIFVTIILVVIICVSVCGNVLICGIVYRRAAMRSGINLLLASLALSDFIIAFVNYPISAVVINLKYWPLGSFMCSVNGVLFNLVNAEKAIVLMIISIDRYFIIVKRADTMTPMKAKLFILLSWSVAIVVSLPPVFGWGQYTYHRGCMQCLLDFNNSSGHNPSYVIFSSTIIVFVPTLALLIMYHRILRTVRRNCFRVQNHPPVTPTAMHKKGKLFLDYSYKTKTSTTILLLSLAFITSILPIGIANVYLAENGFNSNFSMKSYIALLIICYLHALINPLIYYLRIKKFRESLHDLWPQFCVWPSFRPIRSRRRVRPHVVYKVDKREDIFMLSNSSSL